MSDPSGKGIGTELVSGADALGFERDAMRVFIVAGEHSGDALGGSLMASLDRLSPRPIRYFGIGDEHMRAHGLVSLFPIDEITVMGPIAILKRLPHLLRRIRETVDAAIAAEPDALIIIDAPEFTQRVARAVKRRRPDLPVINYVSPSVWAWRPGRAAKMRAYVDHVLALLPFEPEAHERLGGPHCSYVGHPLIEKLDWLRALDTEPLAARLPRSGKQPVLVVLPGSRHSEVSRMMQPFGAALRRLQAGGIEPSVIIPAVDGVRVDIEARARDWPVQPLIVRGQEDKYRAFKLADAALVTSGTVTLEVALAGTPMVVGYKVEGPAALLRPLLKTSSVVLANLVLGRNAFPELLQEDCTGEKFAAAIEPLLRASEVRTAQLAALAEITPRMIIENGPPSDAAARIVLSYLPVTAVDT